MELGIIILFGIGMLVLSIGAIYLIVCGFKTHIGWGLALLFLQSSGLVALLYIILNWKDAKNAFLTQVLGVILMCGSAYGGYSLYQNQKNKPESEQSQMVQAIVKGLKEVDAKLEEVRNNDASANSGDDDFHDADEGIVGILLGSSNSSAEKPQVDERYSAEALYGKTIADIKREFGAADGESNIGYPVLTYEKFLVEFENGKHVSRLVWADKNRDPVIVRSPRKIRRNAAQKKAASVKVIRANGSNIEMSKLLVQGKITVVYFYAEEMPSTKSLVSHIEKIAASDHRVVLRRVDAVNWSSPLVNQYSIEAFPDVRVFDAQRRQVGSASADLAEIRANIATAKASSK